MVEEKVCPICGGSGWDIRKEPVDRCECFEKMMAKQRFESSGITKAMAIKRFENFETPNELLKKAKVTAYKYTQEFTEIRDTGHNSIILMGNSGSGKTHLTMAIANRLLNNCNVGVVYMQYREALTKLKQVITDSFDYQRELEKYQKASVLLIDDLYKGKLTESDVNVMFELINYRYNNNLPIIASTEMTVDELIKVDEATGTRILEMATGRVISFPRRSDMNYRMR